MAENYEFFYEGSPYSLDSGYGNFTGYRMQTGLVGAPTSIQTANQIQEVSNLLNQGIKTVEIQAISPEVFDQIPKQHFKEIARLKKLTGAETTMHAPMIEPSGFTKEGWSEYNREQAERQLKSVIERAHELSPEGHMPVTIHSSGIPGTEFIPTKEGEKMQQMIAVNRDTGQLVPIKREEEYYPSHGLKPIMREPEDRIENINHTEFINKITNLAFYKKEADEILNHAATGIAPIVDKLDKGITKEEQQHFQKPLEQIGRADLFLENIQSSFRDLFDKTAKYGDENSKKVLGEISKQWQEFSVKSAKGEINPIEHIFKKSELLDFSINKLKELERSDNGKMHVPELYVPVEQFATEKASKTFANVAFEGYRKFGDKTPIISIENLFSGMAFSRAEDLKKLVEQTKENFIIKATQEGYSKSAAAEAADKIIGVTWDVGHLNMMRKQGFKTEDIVKETEKISPYVKHVHLTDNFGYSDSHLPPGMGNVPIKEILEKLEKAGYKGKGIVEAGGFAQHFKTSPHPYALEALGSPLYSMMMKPYWNQMPAQGNYFSGYGPFLPEQSFSMYGSGFSTLPTELGGQVGGGRSRVSGTPNQ